MNKIPYNCKFCKREGIAQYDETVVGNVDNWKPYLSCDPCASYHTRRLTLEDKIYNACTRLIIHKGNPDVAGKVRDKLKRLTQSYAAIVCKYLNKGYCWEEDFVEQLIECPNKCRKICYQYRKMVNQML